MHKVFETASISCRCDINILSVKALRLQPFRRRSSIFTWVDRYVVDHTGQRNAHGFSCQPQRPGDYCLVELGKMCFQAEKRARS